ncbi:hypothetical protein HOY80DRAFT_907058 [Tuber brumale]|nr:hypothetical protein HOY80DRAFT_907058 [Tuber brumale]
MVLAESKNKVGLGRALMNSRSGSAHKTNNKHRGNGAGRGGKGTGSGQSEMLYTTEKHEADWHKMRSITQQNDLDEFLNTAELADTDFTAEKMSNMKIIHKGQINPYLLTADEEKAAKTKHRQNKQQLTVPRRPYWDSATTPAELERREKDSFLHWRRGLAELQETKDLLMTPFERNLEVWRQLWRVIERSDLVVQIVDARNPLMFRSEDLERYVKEVDERKGNLLLVNKADMMTAEQRSAWADYFEKEGISYRFFSAALAKQINEEYYSEDEEEKSVEEEVVVVEEEKEEPRIRILTIDELEEVFLEHASTVKDEDPEKPRKSQIGLVGYPNVGKSSTINALIGAKKVSVSSTPGKTKHFQTLHLSEKIVLCDCPGLVFPNFATTKAELVCNGVLPIDQLREFSGPTTLVAQRIPQQFLESLYGIKIHTRPFEEGGTGIPTGEELLMAYARARGFYKTGAGIPDESRAARYILKDYVNGKLLFCHPPPAGSPIDPLNFNKGLYDEAHLPRNRRTGASLGQDNDDDLTSEYLPVAEMGEKSHDLDRKFFVEGQVNLGYVKTPFHLGAGAAGALPGGKHLSGRKARTMIALDNNLSPEEVRKAMGGKKHFKGRKNIK